MNQSGIHDQPSFLPRGLAGVMLLLLAQIGCQTDPVTPPRPAARNVTVRTGQSSAGVLLDDQTAQQLLTQRSSPAAVPQAAPAAGTAAPAALPASDPDPALPADHPGGYAPSATGLPADHPAATVAAETNVPRVGPAGESNGPPPLAAVAAPPCELRPGPAGVKPACLAALEQSDQADQLISVNFDQADIRYVIKTVSEITGVKFIVDDAVTGTVTVLSPTKMRLGDLYAFLESILAVKGYAALAGGDHVKIVPRAQAPQRNLQLRIGADPADIPPDDALATQIMPLRYADATEVVALLTPRLPPGAQLSVYQRTNTLFLTDTSANIRLVAQILQEIDVPGAQEEHVVIPLKYASAQTLSRQILEILEQDPTSRARRASGPGQVNPRLQIQPDQRTNSLIVIAHQADVQAIRELVARLDVERPAGVDNMHVVYLKNAQAQELAEALTKALAQAQPAAAAAAGAEPAIQITPDLSTNSLIINASPPDYKMVGDIIAKLDIVREMVLVELLIVEVSQDNLREIGVDWATLDNAVADSFRGFGGTNFGIRATAQSGDLQGLAVGAWKQVGGETKIGAILAALENVRDVNILSTPHLLTSNHRQAEIVVGDNIPFVIQSRITETDPSTPTVIKTVEYKDVGVKLKITPHISQGGLVRLALESEFSQVIESVTGVSADTPTTATRRIKDEITMPDATTVVIGGLIRDDKIKVENKIPLLGDLPLVGGLFRFQRDRTQKTNLLLFITPYVLTTGEDLAQATERKQAQAFPADQGFHDPQAPAAPPAAAKLER